MSIYLDSGARDHGKSAVIWIFREFSNFHSDRHRLCSSSSCISRLRISKFKMAAILSTIKVLNLAARNGGMKKVGESRFLLSLRASSPVWASETGLARSREARFACPNRRACSLANSSWSCLWCLVFRWFPISVPQFRAHVKVLSIRLSFCVLLSSIHHHFEGILCIYRWHRPNIYNHYFERPIWYWSLLNGNS